MNKKKILVADDNRVILRALSIKLRTAGYDVLTAEDGGEAVRLARTQKPDLILLDIHFPNIPGGGVSWDGFGLMDWLRRQEEAKDIPIIVITSETSAQCKNQAQAAGAVNFFQKPIRPEELLPAIRQALGQPPEPPPGAEPLSATDPRKV